MEKCNAQEFCDVAILRSSSVSDDVELCGIYYARCLDKEGNVKWEDTIDNMVTNVGKNLLLDSGLSTAQTVVGPFMGLIGASGYTTVGTVVDTMTSHAGWVEAGTSTTPLYTAPRKTCVWSAASTGSKALSAALSFAITPTGGTVKGCFLVMGTGAVSTIGDTNGTLYSAGLFTGGDKVVSSGDTLQVSYTASL